MNSCLLYTSDAADDTPCVDLGGRRIIKKNSSSNHYDFTLNIFTGTAAIYKIPARSAASGCKNV